MNEEIKAMREEIARLRERVAVLESSQQPAHAAGVRLTDIMRQMQRPPGTPYPPYTVTCQQTRPHNEMLFTEGGR